MVLKFVGKVCTSVLAVLLSWVWAVQCSGLLAAVIKELNEVSITSLMIKVITVVISVVALILIWSGVLSLSTIKTVKATSAVVNVYFLTLIGITVAYMAVLGDIKYVMVAELLGAWIIWFVILNALSNIRKSIEVASKPSEVKEESKEVIS